MVLDIGKTISPTPKCYFTHSTLPNYLDTKQPPKNRKPFSSVLSQPYYHTLTILSPSKAPAPDPQPQVPTSTPQSSSSSRLTNLASKFNYFRLKCPLSSLLSGDFWNKHIKSGNVILLSSPLISTTTSSSTTFTLVEGVLSIELDKATYERAGLQGSKIPDPFGKRHGDGKWRVEVNLRVPNMVSGKKGFERLKRAAEKVFVGEVGWVGWDVDGKGSETGSGMEGLGLEVRKLSTETEVLEKVLIPRFPGKVGQGMEEEVLGLLEWIGMVMMGSHRVREGDKVDVLLSRYDVGTETLIGDVVLERVKDFLPAREVLEVVGRMGMVGRSIGDETGNGDGDWMAVRLEGFEGRDCVVLKLGDGTAMTWQF